MAYSIRITTAAEKDLHAVDRPVRVRLIAAIEELAANPLPAGALKMEGFKAPLYRIRVGSYRIVYQIHRQELLVLVTAAAERGAIYRLIKRRGIR